MSGVITETSGAVLTVTFNRPSAYNAMTFDMYDALYEACVQADINDEIRVMVLRGSGGKAFVAGTDIPQLEQYTNTHGGLAYETHFERVVSRLESVNVPVVAAVNGVAAGAGVVFVLTADLCICTTGSRFGAPIAHTLGNCLSVRNCERLAQAIGIRRAKAVLLTADLIDAEQARQAGLVNEVVALEDFDKHLHDRPYQPPAQHDVALQFGGTRSLFSRPLRFPFFLERAEPFFKVGTFVTGTNEVIVLVHQCVSRLGC